MTAKCPNKKCKSKADPKKYPPKFSTPVHVVSHHIVDAEGEILGPDERDEDAMTEGPDEGNQWSCLYCSTTAVHE